MSPELRDRAANVRAAGRLVAELATAGGRPEPIWHRHERRRDDAALTRIAAAVEAQREADAEFMAAVLAARRSHVSLRTIARHLGIPHTTLADRLRRMDGA